MLVTGLGMISPLGVGKTANWSSVLAGGNSIVKLDESIVGNSECKIGGQLKKSVFDPDQYATSFKFRTSSLAAALAE